MLPLDLVTLTALMARTKGDPNIRIGLIDGPVFTKHPDLDTTNLNQVGNNMPFACAKQYSTACVHGTFIAGVLSAKRGSVAPAICPGSTLLVRSIFVETASNAHSTPGAKPAELVSALYECMDAGASILNLSLGLAPAESMHQKALTEALDAALKRNVLVVAAAGNQSRFDSSPITRHPWVIPVAGCDLNGRLSSESNFGHSIGKHGLRAPATNITSLSSVGKPLSFSGTSAAVPFVTGAIALLWAQFPEANAAQIKLAVTQSATRRRTGIVPPLLDAQAAYRTLMQDVGKMEEER